MLFLLGVNTKNKNKPAKNIYQKMKMNLFVFVSGQVEPKKLPENTIVETNKYLEVKKKIKELKKGDSFAWRGAWYTVENIIEANLIDLFKTEIHERGAEIDPDNVQDWFSLTLGWAIAKGLSPEDAYKFSLYIRYSTSLG